MAKPAKKKIYFNEYNIVLNGSTYLPLVSGTLHAYANKFSELEDAYEVAPYLFKTDLSSNILAAYEDPEVAAFSMYSWNANLSLHIAKEVKARYPNCLIIFGGGSVEHDPTAFMEEHPYIDVCVRGEGEDPFVEVLRQNLINRDFTGVPQVSWRKDGNIVVNKEDVEYSRDMDARPSPYLTGLFDSTLRDNPDISFQAIIESNRGCPFKCTFCYWGMGGLGRRYKYHSLERTIQEIEWQGVNKIEYLFCADSNFGMHKRDMEIAKALSATKQKYGYPKFFRACYGKNTDENIFAVGKELFDHGLDKGVNLSRQSNNKSVLAKIKRGNIKMETYHNLQSKFSDSGIPTWTELILGLPGESYETFIEGVGELLDTDLKGMYIYWLEVYPNTDMADPEYQAKHGMEIVKSQIKAIHCPVSEDDQVTEAQNLVVATHAMPHEQWRRAWKFSWLLTTLHGLQIGTHVLSYLRKRFDIPYTAFIEHLVDKSPQLHPEGLLTRELQFYEEQLSLIVDGNGWGIVVPGYGDIYWYVEDASFLRLCEQRDAFYTELEDHLVSFLKEKGIKFNPVELSEVIKYQWMRMPSVNAPIIQQWEFEYNIPEYMESVKSAEPIDITHQNQVLYINPTDYGDDGEKFAMEHAVFGRKNARVLWPTAWYPSTEAPHETQPRGEKLPKAPEIDGVGVW